MDNSHNILVVGNGFDLYHGRKTSYMDFVRFVEEAFAQSKDRRDAVQTRMTELCNVNGFFRHFHFAMSENLSWTWFEGEMDNIVTALAHFQAVMLENQKDPEYDPAAYNIISGLFSYNDMQIFKHFARVFEQIYDDPSGGLFKLRQQFITPEKRLNPTALVAEVRRELERFTEALDLYLTAVAGEAGESKAAAASCSRQIAEIQPDYVINFNYTDTVKMYGIPDEHIFYAKGKAGKEPSRLVLGSPDGFEEPADWICLKTYFLKLMHMVGLPDREQLYPVDEEGNAVPVKIHYFGYSFPDADADLICELDAIAAKTVIYCTDREDYAYKVIRLIKLFGKDAVTEKLYDGAYCFEMIEG
ncbi:MAG: bacteriophage abortive infection AbiH family protein [Clostridiales bacterium]|nr:bacteriophage abortive infection AbiH family protein [Clostridiales bacterium]